MVKGIAGCGSNLSKWNSEVFGNLNFMIRKKEKELTKLLGSKKPEAHKIKSIQNELSKLLH